MLQFILDFSKSKTFELYPEVWITKGKLLESYVYFGACIEIL
jgi:hypothetical protein